MLPNLAGLALEAHKAAPTAEFYTLKDEEVIALEQEGQVEIYSQETPEAHNKDTFRIAKHRNAKPGVVNDYNWYDGIQLWEWAQDHELDPLRKPWSAEDMEALHDRYDPGVREFFEGPVGEERKVRTQHPDGEIQFFEGPKGKERMVRAELPSGQLQFYKGPMDDERLVRVELPSGQKAFFEGPKGEERTVRMEFADGEKAFFEGPVDEEHRVRVELPNGQKEFFEGVKGEERRVRVEVLTA